MDSVPLLWRSPPPFLSAATPSPKHFLILDKFPWQLKSPSARGLPWRLNLAPCPQLRKALHLQGSKAHRKSGERATEAGHLPREAGRSQRPPGSGPSCSRPDAGWATPSVEAPSPGRPLPGLPCPLSPHPHGLHGLGAHSVHTGQMLPC